MSRQGPENRVEINNPQDGDGRMDRRQFVRGGLGVLGVAAVAGLAWLAGRGGLGPNVVSGSKDGGQPGNPGANAGGQEGGQGNSGPATGSTSVDTSANTVTTVETQNSSYKFPAPVDFRPEQANGVKNVLLEQAPKGVWFHPMTEIRFLNNQKHVWSYDYYYLNASDDLVLVQHGGEEGKMFFRQNHRRPAHLVVGVGRMTEFTDSAGKKHDLRGNVQGGEAMINIRTHPFVTVRAWNPDTGERLMLNGKPVEGVTSDAGDIGFVLGNSGRAVFDAVIPVDEGLETIVWEGPHDRTNLKLNIIDIRPALSASGSATTTKGK